MGVTKAWLGWFVGILFVNRRIDHRGVQGIGIIPSQDTRGIAHRMLIYVQVMGNVLDVLGPHPSSGSDQSSIDIDCELFW